MTFVIIVINVYEIICMMMHSIAELLDINLTILKDFYNCPRESHDC